jgi:large subunit ribosomal protein L29
MAKVDLQALSDEALVHHELQLERDLVRRNFAHKTNQLENTAELKVLRRDIARTRTEERTREVAQGLAKDALRNRFRATFKPDVAASSTDSAAQGGTGGFLSGIANKFGLGGGDDEASAT